MSGAHMLTDVLVANRRYGVVRTAVKDSTIFTSSKYTKPLCQYITAALVGECTMVEHSLSDPLMTCLDYLSYDVWNKKKGAVVDESVTSAGFNIDVRLINPIFLIDSKNMQKKVSLFDAVLFFLRSISSSELQKINTNPFLYDALGRWVMVLANVPGVEPDPMVEFLVFLLDNIPNDDSPQRLTLLIFRVLDSLMYHSTYVRDAVCNMYPQVIERLYKILLNQPATVTPGEEFLSPFLGLKILCNMCQLLNPRLARIGTVAIGQVTARKWEAMDTTAFRSMEDTVPIMQLVARELSEARRGKYTSDYQNIQVLFDFLLYTFRGVVFFEKNISTKDALGRFGLYHRILGAQFPGDASCGEFFTAFLDFLEHAFPLLPLHCLDRMLNVLTASLEMFRRTISDITGAVFSSVGTDCGTIDAVEANLRLQALCLQHSCSHLMQIPYSLSSMTMTLVTQIKALEQKESERLYLEENQQKQISLGISGLKVSVCQNLSCQNITENAKRCQGCYTARYCSRSCQEMDWPNHKEACVSAQRMRKCGNTPCDKPPKSKCSRCESVWYCASTCQRAHWPTHKKTCGVGPK
eukprot:TRINITY_DN15136_c0_g1_i1.p1 TRINITY_DN15136_c0_g1~~TRINITY_DN15136_c0_g1_i1.p1  ORF type:complete len:580 (-),score=102.39 TRINITY_DN15136_c0_g1_i1:68-1807(-)